jgi:GNAT superfamily N-acetyltransferase
MSIGIRDAVDADTPKISELALQLGYSVCAKDIASRLAQHSKQSDSRVVVAVDGARVVGWTTFRLSKKIHSKPVVEVSGFVVEQELRRKGIGKKMMAYVENWATEHRIYTVRLNANSTRAEAHRFYEAIGFKKIKEQIAFQKELPD